MECVLLVLVLSVLFPYFVYLRTLCYVSEVVALACFFPECFCSLVEYLALGILPALGLPLPLWLLEDRNQYFVFLLTLCMYVPPPLYLFKDGKESSEGRSMGICGRTQGCGWKNQGKGFVSSNVTALVGFFLISSDKMALSCCSSSVISCHVSRVQSFERLLPCPGNLVTHLLYEKKKKNSQHFVLHLKYAMI